MKDFYGEVYIVINLANHKVYIGQTVRTLHERWLAHCRRAKTSGRGCVYLYNAIRKYGEGSFSVYRLNVAFSKEELDALEIFYIEKFKACDPEYGYNSTLGGGGVVANEVTRQKFREANKGERNPRFGKPVSDETRKKLSKAMKGRPCKGRGNRKSHKAGTPERPHIGVAESNRRRIWSEDSKRKLGEKQRVLKIGKPRPLSVGLAVAEANKVRPAVRWINLDGKALKINTQLLDGYLQRGWKLGRK